LSLLEDFRFHSLTLVAGSVASFFQGTNFKGALIELSFDLGAPLGDALYFGL
jgi:hypothetical protein